MGQHSLWPRLISSVQLVEFQSTLKNIYLKRWLLSQVGIQFEKTASKGFPAMDGAGIKQEPETKLMTEWSGWNINDSPLSPLVNQFTFFPSLSLSHFLVGIAFNWIPFEGWCRQLCKWNWTLLLSLSLSSPKRGWIICNEQGTRNQNDDFSLSLISFSGAELTRGEKLESHKWMFLRLLMNPSFFLFFLFLLFPVRSSSLHFTFDEMCKWGEELQLIRSEREGRENFLFNFPSLIKSTFILLSLSLPRLHLKQENSSSHFVN